MKTICKFSGLILMQSDDCIPAVLSSAHPVFQLGRENIYAMMRKFPISQNSAEGSDNRKRLYFLGLLHSTNLTIWDRPFNPDNETVENCFAPLLHFLQTFPAQPSNEWLAKFPKIRLSECNDIFAIIKEWRLIARGLGQLVGNTSANQSELARQADLALAQRDVWNQIKLNKLDDKYFSFLEFQLCNTETPDSTVADWLEMLRRPVDKTIQKDYYKLIALKQVLVDCLPMTDASRQKSFYVLRFVQNKLDEATKQQADMLGCDVVRVKETLANVETFKVVIATPSASREDQEPVAAMPQRNQFSTAADYAKAKSAWFQSQQND